jgi:hypothetical protein
MIAFILREGGLVGGSLRSKAQATQGLLARVLNQEEHFLYMKLLCLTDERVQGGSRALLNCDCCALLSMKCVTTRLRTHLRD